MIHKIFISIFSFLFKLKYHELYNDNGESYFLTPNFFQTTRQWMDKFHGSELSDGIFHFCRSLRKLQLSENEFALVLPLHMCYHGKIR